MKIREVIEAADNARPNTVDDRTKCKWLVNLNMEIAEMMEITAPEFVYPDLEYELLMPAPYDEVYVAYLKAKIDYEMKETEDYANDYQEYNYMMADGRAWWRRHHVPQPVGAWRI